MDLSDWQYLRPRTAFLSANEILEMVVRHSFRIPGNIVEFGVAEGHSTRAIRLAASECEKHVPAHARKRIYACDSFEGLPEKFENLKIGAFATEPPHIPGVNIVKGSFEDSLTDELAAEIGLVAFASLDADLYSSTLCALNWLTPLLRTGSLLLFDEFLGEKESEKRAFEKWSRETGCRTVLIGQFLREPSGRGTMLDRGTLDQRTLFQIVKKEPLSAIPPKPADGSLRGQLSKYPPLYNAARQIYRLFR
jgi:predicted O-methyltransferase YrrM